MKPKQSKKRKSRRDKVKYPALQKEFMPRVRGEYLDYDYLDQLSEKEKEWLNKFTDEYLNASFNHDETDIQSYEKYGKDANDRNNARNRCTQSQFRSGKKTLLSYESLSEIKLEKINQYHNPNPKALEDNYIDFLEAKEIEEMMQEYVDAMSTLNDNTTQE